MSENKVIKVGDILSENQFYMVKEINDDTVVVVNDNGEDICVDTRLVVNCCNSADFFSSEIEVTRTDLIKIFMSVPRIAITANFNKKLNKKSVKDAVLELYPNSGGKLRSQKDYKKSIVSTINSMFDGEPRTIRGRHYGTYDNTGRVQFIDMDIDRADRTDRDGKLYDTRLRAVDTRTLNWIIVNDVKYIVKGK